MVLKNWKQQPKCFIPNPVKISGSYTLETVFYFQTTKCGFPAQIPKNYTIEMIKTTCKKCRTILRVERVRREMGLE